jgi:DNA polymerase III epsilon subunit-like protein
MKQKTFFVFDTETTGIGSRPMVFDFAYVIATRTKILCERKFLIREILTSPKIMLAALYNETWRDMMGGKLFRHYIPGLHSGELALHDWRDVLAQMRDDILTYGVDVIAAYNLGFDLRAMNKTHQRITEKNINFSRFDLLCLWEFSCVTVCKETLYHQVAWQQGKTTGWITDANNVRTNAEKVYAFLSGDLNFIESHTALEDAQIETEILQRLLAKRKTIPYNVLDHMPWRKAQTVHGQLF